MPLTPISILIDDSAPLVHVYKEHAKDSKTYDGRPMISKVPNSFLDRFCDIAERWGIRGKFSIVPSPGDFGDIVNGIPGYDMKELKYWLDTVKKRLVKDFDFSPEMLTHNHALDLSTGKYLDLNERDWSMKQDRTTLTPYITRALELLKKAGFDANGVTSPWDFGSQVEAEYTASIAAAQQAVYGRKISWYFMLVRPGQPNIRPWLSYDDNNKDSCKVMHIPSTVKDFFWQTIDCADESEKYIASIADKFISNDGKTGMIIDMMAINSWPIICTHWQSLFSNGLETGLSALELVGERVKKYLGSKLEWKTCMEMTNMILNEK